MRLVFCCLLLLLGGGQAARAQPAPRGGAGTVHGVVRDSVAQQPLREASVSLLLARDSSFVTFGLTDGSGRYVLRGVRPGRYLLLVNALGYQVLRRPVEVAASRPLLELPPLHPRPETRQLGEVVVTHERAPVSISGDTVAFSARAFKTQPNASVEQLLKKLPGLEVDRDGNLRAQGRAVDKLLVDGKPFFGGDPRMATRNLPADIIDQVQLFDQQSEQATFSGVDSGERQHTLNLVTRRDKRRGYFGTEQAGVGTAGRYQARLGLNRFHNGRQLSALAQADNVNRQGFTDDGNPVASAATAPGSASSLGSGNGGFVLAAPGGTQATASSPGGTQAGVTEAASGGLNYRDAWGRRVEVAASYLAARATTHNDQQARRQNLAGPSPGDETSSTDRLVPSTLRSTSQRASLRLDCQFDSLTSLRLSPRLTWQATDQLRRTEQQTTLPGGLLLNQSSSRYAAQANNLAGGGTALLRRQFRRPGRTFSANFDLNLARQSGLAFNQAVNTFYAGGATTTQRLDQQLDQRTASPQGTLSLSYAEPMGVRHKLEAHYSYSTAPSQALRSAAAYDDATGQYDQYLPALSNAFDSRFSAQRAGLTWQTRRLHYTYSLGLDAQQADLRLDNQTAESSLRRRYPSLLPAATFSYTGAGSRTLRLDYRSALAPPTATQLQPVPDNSNPLSIRLGNPDLQPEYRHSLAASYDYFDAARSRSLSVQLSGSAVQQHIATATTFDAAGVRTTRPVNANGYALLTGYLSLGQRLPAHQLNLNASTSASYGRSPSLLNGQPNLARTWSLVQTLSANSSYNEHLELSLRATLTYQQAAYSLVPAQQTATFTQVVDAEVYWRLPGRWMLSTDLYYTASAGLAAGYNPRVLLWNAGLAYQLFASRQGELKLSAFDMLGQNRSAVRTTTDTYLEDVRSQVLPRYLLLSFTYQLRSFGR